MAHSVQDFKYLQQDHVIYSLFVKYGGLVGYIEKLMDNASASFQLKVVKVRIHIHWLLCFKFEICYFKAFYLLRIFLPGRFMLKTIIDVLKHEYSVNVYEYSTLSSVIVPKLMKFVESSISNHSNSIDLASLIFMQKCDLREQCLQPGIITNFVTVSSAFVLPLDDLSIIDKVKLILLENFYAEIVTKCEQYFSNSTIMLELDILFQIFLTSNSNIQSPNIMHLQRNILELCENQLNTFSTLVDINGLVSVLPGDNVALKINGFVQSFMVFSESKYSSDKILKIWDNRMNIETHKLLKSMLLVCLFYTKLQILIIIALLKCASLEPDLQIGINIMFQRVSLFLVLYFVSNHCVCRLSKMVCM